MVRRIGRIGRNVVLGLAATGTIMAAGAAGAQARNNDNSTNKTLTGVSAADIISLMTKNEIQSQQVPATGNDPYILAMLPTGAKFFVNLQGCQEKGTNCQVIRFGAIFTGAELDMADYNDFNSRFVFGKAYQDQEKRMYINHSVSVAGGIQQNAVEFNMFVFFRMAEFFTQFVSERLTSVSASLEQPANKKPGGITNAGGDLPANSMLAGFREAAKKHPEIINKVNKNSRAKWKVK